MEERRRSAWPDVWNTCPSKKPRGLGRELGAGEAQASRSAFRMLANHPELVKHAYGLLTMLFSGNTLRTRLGELIIMRLAWRAGMRAVGAREVAVELAGRVPVGRISAGASDEAQIFHAPAVVMVMGFAAHGVFFLPGSTGPTARVFSDIVGAMEILQSISGLPASFNTMTYAARAHRT
jgi:hypothetical protein